jgi:hypothetical protein
MILLMMMRKRLVFTNETTVREMSSLRGEPNQNSKPRKPRRPKKNQDEGQSLLRSARSEETVLYRTRKGPLVTQRGKSLSDVKRERERERERDSFPEDSVWSLMFLLSGVSSFAVMECGCFKLRVLN